MKKFIVAAIVIILFLVLFLIFFFKSDATDPYKQTTWGKFSGSCNTEEAPSENYGNKFIGCDYSIPDQDIPKFTSLNFPFTNKFDNSKSLPLMASALIDIDNDGIDEVFIAGGITQNDGLFKFDNNSFIEITDIVNLPSKEPNTTNYGAISVDLDNNGFVDLIVCGDDGVKWYKNNGNNFSATKLQIEFNEKSVPISVTAGDINKDGHLDLFVSAYIKLSKMEGQTIFKDMSYGATSLLLLNNGDQSFKNVTSEWGINYIHNTFMAVMVDIDKDGWIDLVVAHDTGEVKTYRNNNGESYDMISNPLTGKYAYPMGIAVGDYNNDSHIDFFFSNTGSSVPEFMARGDLAEEDVFIRKWILFKNTGDFNFINTAENAKISDLEFSWGAIFEDFNLDGKQDLVVAENYVDFPPHKIFKLPCRFLIQRENHTFAAVEDQAGVVNREYAITPLSSDFNNDGYKDFLYINLNGTSAAFINKGGEVNYISVRFKETADNIGSYVTINKIDGTKLTDVYVIGEGLVSDQSNTVTFGIGSDESIISLVIKKLSGEEIVIDNPELNKTYQI